MKWLEGKKTWIGAGLLAAAALWGYWHGIFDATIALGILGAAGVAVGLGDKVDRYAPLMLAALDRVKAQQSAAQQKAGLCAYCDAGRMLDAGVHFWTEGAAMRREPCSKERKV